MGAAVAIANLADADATTVTAAGWITLAPPAKLTSAYPHVGDKWRDNATSTHVLSDLGSSLPVDTFALPGLSGVDPDLRVRLSSADASGAAGDVYDSGTISGLPYFDPNYGLFVFLLPAPLSARYVRIDIAEAGVDYIEAGRLYVGTRDAFGINFSTPWSRAAVRGSVDTMGIGGQTFVDQRTGYWRANASFGFLSEVDRAGFLEEIAVSIVNDGHLDMLWMMDTDSTNLSRDCIWGYRDGGDQVVTQDIDVDPAVYSVEFPIRQRL